METYAPCETCGAINRIAMASVQSKKPICAQCKQRLPVHDGIVQLTDSSFRSFVNHSPLPVVIDFWAGWCGPCHSFAPVFSSVGRTQLGKFVFAKVDTEQNQATTANLGIRSLPTLVVMKGGQELSRTTGAVPVAAFQNWLKGIQAA